MQLSNIENDFSAISFASYLVELTLVDASMLKFRPSLLAASAVYLTKKILLLGQQFTKEL